MDGTENNVQKMAGSSSLAMDKGKEAIGGVIIAISSSLSGR